MKVSYRKHFGGIYIHFPYCIHKCAYCDFFSLGIGKTTIDQKDYFNVLLEELNFRLEIEDFSNLKIDSIFFGGGTPSLIDPIYLEKFLQSIQKKFHFNNSIEITLEANPEDISRSNLQTWSNLGINRINVGIQSFNPLHLQTLDRFHDAQKYKEVLETLSEKIISRYGIDLIYGIPNQSKSDVYDDIQIALDADITHLSCYSLTVEKGTNYSRWIREKRSEPPNEDLQTELLLDLPSYLDSKGYGMYEVSNFSRPGEECRHNLKYWMMEPYLALGPGAHGFTGYKRYANPRSMEAYLKGNYDRNLLETDLYLDFILCTFRIFLPIDLLSFKVFWEDKINFINIIETWKKAGDCEWDGRFFVWKKHVLPKLDLYIAELSNTGEL
jgi:putative oxygen-independent coproporphyrinogen III oxidase